MGWVGYQIPRSGQAPGGGFKYFLCSLLHGEMIQFDEHMLQMGRFNHQLETNYPLQQVCWDNDWDKLMGNEKTAKEHNKNMSKLKFADGCFLSSGKTRKMFFGMLKDQ